MAFNSGPNMKIQPECITCLLKRIIFEAELSTDNPLLRLKTIQNSCKALDAPVSLTTLNNTRAIHTM